MSTLAKNQCPRCLGMIPNNDMPGAYTGALSRLTRGMDDESKMVYVCSACGTDEGMQEAFGGGATPMTWWPIVTESTPTHFTEENRVHDGAKREKGLGHE